MSATVKKRVLVKIGGAALDHPVTRARFASSVKEAVDALGLELAIVHGGGPQLSRYQEQHGLEVKRNERGLRITDPDTARAAVCVLGGEVNAALVSSLTAAAVRAIGLTCADGGLARARTIDPALGAVGELVAVDSAVIEDLTSAGFVPVIATLATDPSEPLGGRFLNVNADAAVAPLAAAWGADVVLFLSDVAGVNGDEGPVPRLDATGAAHLESIGVLMGGMIPKVEAALAAAAALPNALVKIASGATPGAISAALRSDGGTAFGVGGELIHGS